MKFLIILINEFKRVLRRPIFTDATVFTVSQYIAAGLSFITTVVTARILGPGDYGILTLVMSYPLLMWSFMSIKSPPITIRYLSRFRDAGRNEEIKSICKLGYGLDFSISVITFILVSATSWRVAGHMVYLSSQKAWLMIIYAASFLFLSLSVTSWAILSSYRMWWRLATLHILEKIITLVIVFGFLGKGLGVGGVILGITAGNIIFGLSMLGVATYILYRNEVGLWWKASISKIRSLRKELVSFFGWNYLTVSLNGLMTWVPLMLLGFFRGPEEAGFYRLATSLSMLSCYLETSLGKVIYPSLSVQWNSRKQEALQRTLRRLTLHIGLPLGIFFLLSIPLFPSAVFLVFGSGYSQMVSGAQVMMAGFAVSIVFFWLIQLYYASGRISLWTKGYAIYTATVMGLGWFCSQWWGFLGLATLITVARVIFTLSMALGFQNSLPRNSQIRVSTVPATTE